MPQDQQSGAQGDAAGRSRGAKIANLLGATMTRPGSNEATLNGNRVVIKSGKRGTNSVGVSFKMLPSLHSVVAAFGRRDGAYDLFSLPASIYQQRMTMTQSKGPSRGKVGIVPKSIFEAEGQKVATVAL